MIIKEIFSKFKDNSKTNCTFLEFQEFSRTKVIFKDFSRSVRTLHCIRSLHFLRAVSNSFLDSARLHLLHILGWFPYVIALYTFVTLFRGFLIFFFSTYRSCIQLLHLMGCFSYVLALYTFVTLFESCI